MREKSLEQKLVRAVKEKSGIAYKFTSPGHNGVPDRILVFPGGRVVFVEVKAPGRGRLSALQKQEIKRLKALGAEVYVLDSYEGLERVVNGV